MISKTCWRVVSFVGTKVSILILKYDPRPEHFKHIPFGERYEKQLGSKCSSTFPHLLHTKLMSTGISHDVQIICPSPANKIASIFNKLVFEPTVDRGLLWRIIFCWTAIVGPMPVMLSNFSSSSIPVSIPKDWRYCLRPSSNMISNTKLDFPEPLTPDVTVRVFFGIEMSIPLRLWTRAPFIVMVFIQNPLLLPFYSKIRNYYKSINDLINLEIQGIHNIDFLPITLWRKSILLRILN